jgi:hypothetical protein
LYIRGGSPIQNKVLLDGMIVYNPFHSIGFFSVFDPDIIRGVDVYTGGFNAEHGGRISSIMDITTAMEIKNGSPEKFPQQHLLQRRSSKVRLKNKTKKAVEVPRLSCREKLLTSDKTSKSLYSYVDSAGLPFSFNDIYGKISLNGANGSKVNFFGFNFTDRVKYQHIADLHWENLVRNQLRSSFLARTLR